LKNTDSKDLRFSNINLQTTEMKEICSNKKLIIHPIGTKPPHKGLWPLEMATPTCSVAGDHTAVDKPPKPAPKTHKQPSSDSCSHRRFTAVIACRHSPRPKTAVHCYHASRWTPTRQHYHTERSSELSLSLSLSLSLCVSFLLHFWCIFFSSSFFFFIFFFTLSFLRVTRCNRNEDIGRGLGKWKGACKNQALGRGRIKDASGGQLECAAVWLVSVWQREKKYLLPHSATATHVAVALSLKKKIYNIY
jgi:hypothetical protein